MADARGITARRGALRRAAAAAALACAGHPALAVVGPSRDASSAVADSAVMVLQRQGSAAGFCTGVVVAPRAVLTAAHCVPPGADIRIHYRDAAGAPVLLPVAGVVRHPGYRADAIARRERSVDLAVVSLPEPLPTAFRPAVLGSEAGTAVGSRFTVAGFGLAREGEPRSSGRLRAADLAARAPLSDVLLWAEDPSHGGAGACTGDSGGPVLDASGAVAALTLWSAGDGRRRCGALTQAIWLAPYRAWIAEAAGR
ncbi:S1 family peptidase [Lichenibacterium dinghuense]|uniref:S1 family peptidase n=1 Tax=Lichenibacterium dinghuense TaxID=2895977 RepID=UPI001F1F6BA3|nr:S1 family peptidase [Lichenibacterium sp. 6Y81]